MNNLKPHPLCELSRKMTDEEFAPFKEDIRVNGQRQKIHIFEGMILDGFHRHRACEELSFTTSCCSFKGNYEQAVDFVASQNLHRRHDNVSQRAVAALALYDHISFKTMSERTTKVKTGIVDRPANNAEKKERLASTKVGNIFGVGGSTIMDAVSIRKHAPHLIDEIKNNKMTVSGARKLLPKIWSTPKGEHNTPQSRTYIDHQATKVLSDIDKCTPFSIPTLFDSYEKYMGDYLKRLNRMGYKVQVVWCASKVYCQIVGVKEGFNNWGTCKAETDFKSAVLGASRSIKL